MRRNLSKSIAATERFDVPKAMAALALLVSLSAASSPLSEKDRRDVIGKSADLIEQRYVDPQLGRRVAAKLRNSASYPGSMKGTVSANVGFRPIAH